MPSSTTPSTTKKIVSLAAAASLAATVVPASAFAAPDGDAATTTPQDAPTGELVVGMHRHGAKADTSFDVKIMSGGEVVATRELSMFDGADYGTITAKGLADGAYTLVVEADRYVTFEQDFEVDGRCVHVELYNYASVNYDRGDERVGVMLAGDIDGDGDVDEQDASVMRDAIESDDVSYDLTGDGKVDVADLSVIVRNIGETVAAPIVHTISSAVLAESASADMTAGAVASGDLSTIFERGGNDGNEGDSSESSVSLAPTDASTPISESNPVELEISATSEDGLPEASEAVSISPASSDSANAIAEGTFTVEGIDEDGNEMTFTGTLASDGTTLLLDEPTPLADSSASMLAAFASRATAQHADVTRDADGTVVINLGQRVVVKKVTIRVTKTANETNLAEIAHVEFLSDFAERIAEPQLSIPEVTKVTNTNADGLGYKSLTASWTPQTNVTGYELKVEGPGYNKTVRTSDTTYTFVGSADAGTIKSFNTYKVYVRSVSGDWRSAWSEPYVHEATATNKPPAPQNLSSVAGVEKLTFRWSCKYDAENYTLYYKASGDADYTTVDNLTSTSYTAKGLTPEETYTFYVVAHNRNGASPASNTAEGSPLASSLAKTPKYSLLNRDDADGRATSHIKSITGNNSRAYTLVGEDGVTTNQSNSNAERWMDVLLDNKSESYLLVNDWDSGVAYANFRGPCVTLDNTYKMNTFAVIASDKHAAQLYDARIDYRTSDGKTASKKASISTKKDINGKAYYELKTAEPIETDYFEIHLRNFNSGVITISDLKVYEYDSLEDDVAALFSNASRTMLADDATIERIDELEQRANTEDPACGEFHPNRNIILSELAWARELAEGGVVSLDEVHVDNTVTAKGSTSVGAQAFSDYQPLGYVAGAGDTIVVYVEDESGKASRGQNVDMKLVATQTHPEVTAWQSAGIQLKAGRNEITVPRVGSYAKEAGGSLYLQYTGAEGAQNYTVRVTGATKIPTLRVDGVEGDERRQRIEAYVSELSAYCKEIESNHASTHADGDNTLLNRDYSAQECILNSTEIELDGIFYSVPATQVLAAIGGSADKLDTAIEGMEQQMRSYWQFKGLDSDAPSGNVHRAPLTRLNVRYHQMFTGAFMYAGGKHIGIEYGSTGGLFSLSPYEMDTASKTASGGSWAGWGIAHEIGHCINAASYQKTEVTNNIFAQINKTNGTNSSFRTSWRSVYDQLVKDASPHSGNYAVQLAKYWQLHLAYDEGDVRYEYGSAAEARENLFYARMETYMREPGAASVKLTATSGDQGLMQAACAAANKDILDFFRAWGFTPDAATVEYASNYDKEERPIQYIDDDSKAWRDAGKSGMGEDTTVSASISNASGRHVYSNQVQIALSDDAADKSTLLGYEIKRDGKVVAFVSPDKTEYTDVVTTANNRVHTYEVTLVDKLLGKTEACVMEPVKVSHEGVIDKSTWSISTNMTSPTDTAVDGTDENPDADLSADTSHNLIDNDADNAFFGRGTYSERPQITLALGKTEEVAGLKITPVSENYSGDAAGSLVNASDLYKYRLFGYRIETSTDGINWSVAREGDAYTGAANNPSSWVQQTDVKYNEDGTYTLFFNGDDGFLDAKQCSYVRLTATNMTNLALAEIDLVGTTGDDVELVESGFGKLAQDYVFGDGEGQSIPAGSVVFFGEYKGDPAYNMVLLKDQDGHVLDGSQAILAEVPENGKLGETSSGRWVYWFEDKEKTDAEGDTYNEMDQMASLSSVSAELYRVQDAETLAGQRVTAQSLAFDIPASIPDVEITDAHAAADVSEQVMGTYSVRDNMAEGNGKSISLEAAENDNARIGEAGSALSDAQMSAAMTGENVESASELFARSMAYGDTGETSDTIVSLPVTFTQAGDGTYDVAFKLADIAIAGELVIECNPALGMDDVEIPESASDYVTVVSKSDGLHILAVAREGVVGDEVVHVKVTIPTDEDVSMSAKKVTEIDGTYFTRERTATGDMAQNGIPGEDGDIEDEIKAAGAAIVEQGAISRKELTNKLVEAGYDADDVAAVIDSILTQQDEAANAVKVAKDMATQGKKRGEVMEHLVSQKGYPQDIAEYACDAAGLTVQDKTEAKRALDDLKAKLEREPELTRSEALDYLVGELGYSQEASVSAVDELGLKDKEPGGDEGDDKTDAEKAAEALKAFIADYKGDKAKTDGIKYLTETCGFSEGVAKAAVEAVGLVDKADSGDDGDDNQGGDDKPNKPGDNDNKPGGDGDNDKPNVPGDDNDNKGDGNGNGDGDDQNQGGDNVNWGDNNNGSDNAGTGNENGNISDTGNEGANGAGDENGTDDNVNGEEQTKVTENDIAQLGDDKAIPTLLVSAAAALIAAGAALIRRKRNEEE